LQPPVVVQEVAEEIQVLEPAEMEETLARSPAPQEAVVAVAEALC